MINSRIKEILKSHNISYEDGMTYLLSIFHDCIPSYIPSLLVKKMNLTKIFEFDTKGVVTWLVPLFEEQLTKFEWVKDYRDAFKKVNPERAGTLSTCVARFKKFFAENPEVRVDEVREAVFRYINSTSPAYIMKSHNFIFMGRGAEKTSELEVWIERVKEDREEVLNRKSNTNTLQ